MDILRIAAFSTNGQGGNPAGVVLLDQLPDEATMQKVAAEVGYSETVFAAPEENAFRTRYFAPEAEVPFCGHATIALGAALGAAHGAKEFDLRLNHTSITVRANETNEGWSAELTSPATQNRNAAPGLISDALSLFGWSSDDLAPSRKMARANAGAEHLLIPLKSRDLLANMRYDFEQGRILMQKYNLVTINLHFTESPSLIHSRNPFAGHGVYEDPATGAAAAALGGYRRDALGDASGFTVHQGFDMKSPSTLHVQPLKGVAAPVLISGAARHIMH